MPPPTITIFSRESECIAATSDASVKSKLLFALQKSNRFTPGRLLYPWSRCCTVALPIRGPNRDDIGGSQMRDVSRRCLVVQGVLGLVWLAAPSGFVIPAKAQGYPDRPVKIVVPF